MFGIFGKKDIDLNWHTLFGSYVGFLAALRRDNVNVYNIGVEGLAKLFSEHLASCYKVKMSALQVDDVLHANMIYLMESEQVNSLLNDFLAAKSDIDSESAYESLREYFAARLVLMGIKSA